MYYLVYLPKLKSVFTIQHLEFLLQNLYYSTPEKRVLMPNIYNGSISTFEEE